MLKNRLCYLAALLAAAGYLFAYDGWIAAYAMLAVLCLPVLSLLFTLPLLTAAKKPENGLHIAADPVISRGEACVVTAEIGQPDADGKKKRLFPLCYRVRMIREDRMSGETVRFTLTLSAASEASASFVPKHCCVTECRAERCWMYDLLGLFRFRLPCPTPVTVLIRPTPRAPEPLPPFSDFRAVTFRPKRGGGFSEVHELRAYRPGDPLKSVHWKLSAKRDDLIVREAQETLRRTAWIALAAPKDRNMLDAVLDEGLWLAQELLRRGVDCRIGWEGMHPTVIRGQSSLEDGFAALLRTPIRAFPKSGESATGRSGKAAADPGTVYLRVTGEHSGHSDGKETEGDV